MGHPCSGGNGVVEQLKPLSVFMLDGIVDKGCGL